MLVIEYVEPIDGKVPEMYELSSVSHFEITDDKLTFNVAKKNIEIKSKRNVLLKLKNAFVAAQNPVSPNTTSPISSPRIKIINEKNVEAPEQRIKKEKKKRTSEKNESGKEEKPKKPKEPKEGQEKKPTESKEGQEKNSTEAKEGHDKKKPKERKKKEIVNDNVNDKTQDDSNIPKDSKPVSDPLEQSPRRVSNSTPQSPSNNTRSWGEISQKHSFQNLSLASQNTENSSDNENSDALSLSHSSGAVKRERDAKRESIFGLQRLQERRESSPNVLVEKSGAPIPILSSVEGPKRSISNVSIANNAKILQQQNSSNKLIQTQDEVKKKSSSSFIEDLQKSDVKDKRKSDIISDFRSKSHSKLGDTTSKQEVRSPFGGLRLGKKERQNSGVFEPSKISLDYPQVTNIVSFEAIPEIIDETSYSDSESKSEIEGGFEKNTKETVVVSTTPKKYKELSKQEKKDHEKTRKFIANEILSTEKSYCEALSVCLNYYQKPLMAKASQLGETEQKIQAIFGTWETIVNFHERFYAKLDEVVQQWDVNPCMGDVFCNHGPGLSIYASYAENYAANFNKFIVMEKKNTKFKSEVDTCYSSSKFSLRINDLLIMPVQRIPRYVLLISDLIKNTAVDHEDYNKLNQGLKVIQEMATLVNETVRKRDHDVRLQELLKEGIDLSHVIRTSSLFIRDGVTKVEVKKVNGNSNPTKDIQHWFLFSDILVHVSKQILSKLKPDDFSEYSVPLALCWLSPTVNNKKFGFCLRLPNEELYFNDPEWESIIQQSVDTHLQYRDLKLSKYYKGDFQNNKNYRVAEYTNSLSGTYLGQYLDGNRHGKGKWIFRGSTYKGEWLNDKPHGKGRFRYSTGGLCIGNWKNGLQDGFCKLRLIDGTVYIGKWLDGFRHGHGVIDWPNKDSYQGNWKKDRISGFGRLTCKSGLIYIGNWKKNMFHGTGLSYEGNFARGLRNGRGKLKYADGSWYIGSFENGIKQGIGSYTQNKGDCYVGLFSNDFYDGLGEIVYANGSTFEGEWKRGKRSGKGKFSDVQNNSVYEGDWENDMKHGQGVYTAEGTTYTGTWEKDKMENSFNVMYADGSKFDGIFANGVKVKGKYTGLLDTSILTYDGEWKGGMVTGKGILTLGSGKTIKGSFEQGTYHGNVVINHAIGTEKALYESSLFQNDTRDGSITVSCLTDKNDEVTGTCTSNMLTSPSQGYWVPIEPSSPCWSRSLQTAEFS